MKRKTMMKMDELDLLEQVVQAEKEDKRIKVEFIAERKQKWDEFKQSLKEMDEQFDQRKANNDEKRRQSLLLYYKSQYEKLSSIKPAEEKCKQSPKHSVKRPSSDILDRVRCSLPLKKRCVVQQQPEKEKKPNPPLYLPSLVPIMQKSAVSPIDSGPISPDSTTNTTAVPVEQSHKTKDIFRTEHRQSKPAILVEPHIEKKKGKEKTPLFKQVEARARKSIPPKPKPPIASSAKHPTVISKMGKGRIGGLMDAPAMYNKK